MKFEGLRKSTKPGGKTEEWKMSGDCTENEMAIMAKFGPVLERMFNRMADEQERHHKVMEQLERDKFEHQKEQDEKDAFWKSRYEEADKERDEMREELREVKDKLWDYEHGLKTPGVQTVDIEDDE